MSVAVTAMVAAIKSVRPPVYAITSKTSGVSTGKKRPTRYTPAATIVAECTSAETGVGPSIASGNQTKSGTCALLPTQPQKIPRPATKRSHLPYPCSRQSGTAAATSRLNSPLLGLAATIFSI